MNSEIYIKTLVYLLGVKSDFVIKVLKVDSDKNVKIKTSEGKFTLDKDLCDKITVVNIK